MNDINDINDTQQLPPIQLLIASCATIEDQETRLGWLQGYCVLTFRPVGAGLQLDGEVCIGERYGENSAMIQDLADALDPDAVLAGYDLTDTIGRLGRLPIGAKDPDPSLNLLAKLKTMLEQRSPIDLALTEDSQTEVTLQALRHQLGFGEELDGSEEDFPPDFAFDTAGQDHGNPHQMAVDLANMAGDCLLALGNIYLADELRPQLLAAWQEWRDNFKPRLPLPQNGGEPIIIA